MNLKILTIFLLAIVVLSAGCTSAPSSKNKASTNNNSTNVSAKLPIGEREISATLDETGYKTDQKFTAIINDTYVTKINYPPVNYRVQAKNVTKFGNISVKVYMPGNLTAEARRLLVNTEMGSISTDFDALVAAGFNNISLQMNEPGISTQEIEYSGVAEKGGRKYAVTDNTISTDLDGFVVSLGDGFDLSLHDNSTTTEKYYYEIPGINRCVASYNARLRFVNSPASVKAIEDVTYWDGQTQRHELGSVFDVFEGICYVVNGPKSCKPAIVLTVTGPDRLSKVAYWLAFVKYYIAQDHYKFA